MKDVLELETRRDIYELVSDQPGIHLSKIADILEMTVSLAEYHLRFLEKNHLIRSVKKSGYKRYFPTEDMVKERDKDILFEIRKEVPLKIVLLLLKNKKMTHKQIHQEMDLAASTLSYHLKKLSKLNILESKRYGRKKGYSVVDEKKIIALLVKYKPHDILDGFTDIWKDLKI